MFYKSIHTNCEPYEA